MKTQMFYCTVAAIFFFSLTGNLSAQATTTTAEKNAVVLDAKNQAKVDKEKVDLAKNQQKLNKEMASYEKQKMKYDKDIQSGKLSPRDKEKEEKKMTKANMTIGKLKQKIAKNEEFLAKYNL